MWETIGKVQYVSVRAWVFDFRKFIPITDIPLQAIHSLRSNRKRLFPAGLTHERYIQISNSITPMGCTQVWSSFRAFDLSKFTDLFRSLAN